MTKTIIVIILFIFAAFVAFTIGFKRGRTDAKDGHVLGKFIIDTRDNNKDIYRIELDCPVNALGVKDYVILNIELLQ